MLPKPILYFFSILTFAVLFVTVDKVSAGTPDDQLPFYFSEGVLVLPIVRTETEERYFAALRCEEGICRLLELRSKIELCSTNKTNFSPLPIICY